MPVNGSPAGSTGAMSSGQTKSAFALMAQTAGPLGHLVAARPPAISASKVAHLCIPGPFFILFELPQRTDSHGFMDFFERSVLPTLSALTDGKFILQQDRAPTHTSRYSTGRFEELGVELLSWPSRSQDLNII